MVTLGVSWGGLCLGLSDQLEHMAEELSPPPTIEWPDFYSQEEPSLNSHQTG